MKRQFYMEENQSQNMEPANITEYYNSNVYLNCVKKTSFEGIHPSPSKPIMSPTMIRFTSPTDPSNFVTITLTMEQTENIRRESEYFARVFNESECNLKDGVVIEEENVSEAGYLLGCIADIPPLTDLTAMQWKFNLILAKLSAKWMIHRFIEFFTRLMDREIAKICDVRSCNVVMVSGENEGVFIPHPRKPNTYVSIKNNKASSIEFVSSMCENNRVFYAWELSIGIRKPDGKTEVGKVAFPCQQDTLLKDCQGSWDGHDIKFRLAIRDEKYIKAFIAISELVLTCNYFQQGMYIRNRDDIINILKHHQELWTQAVFDRLFSKVELEEFVLLHCSPKV
jgi:hypothetical protein